MLKIKHIIPVLVLAAARLGAQSAPIQPFAVTDVHNPIQAKSQSEEKLRSGTIFTNDVDNIADVNGWSSLSLQRYFFFAKYSMASLSGISTLDMQNVELGFAAKLKAGYFALLYHGFDNSGSGYTTDTGGNTYSTGTANGITNNLALFYAKDSLGALRLDINFQNYTQTDTSGYGEQSTSTSSGKFGAAVQWGKNFEVTKLGGTLKPSVLAGFVLPNFTTTTINGVKVTERGTAGKSYPVKSDNITPDVGSDGLVYGRLNADLARTAWTFGLRYSVYGDLGYEKKGAGYDESRGGQVWNELRLRAKRKFAVTDKFSWGLDPHLYFGFYNWDGKYTIGENSVNYNSVFGFEFRPALNIGLKYDVKEKLSLYAGTQFNVLSVQYAKTGDGLYYTKGSAWKVVNTADPDLRFGLTITPIQNLGIEIGTTVSSVWNLVDDVFASFANGTSFSNGAGVNVGILLRYKAGGTAAAAE